MSNIPYQIIIPPNIKIETIILVIIVILIAIIIRYLLIKFLRTLEGRNIITIGTRALITRILDIIILIFTVIVTVQIITAELTQYIIVLAVGIFMFILFYYEIREFTAFVAIQLERRALKTWVEIYPPNLSNSIKGRIIEIQPFSSTIEDIYGNKMHIANSILLHSLIREYTPNVQLKITITYKENPNIDEFFKIIKDALSRSYFRIDEQSFTLKTFNKDSITFIIKMIPQQVPLRKMDIYKIIREILKAFPENSITIELID
jgi:hypothetical protein